MTLFDKIITAALCIFFISGWVRGFLKSLIGPVSFLCCFISAVIFYDLNRNILMATVIATAGTLAMALTLNILLMIALSTVNKELRGKTFFISRLLGSVINVVWQGNIFLVFIMLFSLLPLNNEKLENIQKQVSDSKIAAWYHQQVISRDNRLEAVMLSFSTLKNPAQLRAIAQTKTFEEFYRKEKVQNFLNDPQVIDALAAKDSIRLINNKSLRDLITDDETMFALTRVVRKIYQDNLKNLEEVPKEKPKD